MLKTVTYVDKDTGEIIKNQKTTVPDMFTDRGYLFWCRKSYTKIFCDIDFPKSLTPIDIGRFVLLSQYIRPSTNMFAKKTHSGIVPLTIKTIEPIIQLQRRETITYIHKLEDLRLIAGIMDGKIKIYYANPIYAFAGKRINLALYSIFKNELDCVLPVWVQKKFEEQMTQKEKDEKGGSN